MFNDSQVSAIRARFRIFREKTYLNSCSQGALSDAVEQAFLQYLESWHRGGSPWDLWVEKYEEMRAAFARFIGAKAEEVAVVPSASAGINAVASALDFRERKKVVLGEFEFPTMGHAWLAQGKRGAQVQFVEAEGNHIPLRAYEKAIDAQTAIVPITGVCFMNGFRSPVAAARDLAHRNGAFLMLDDYQDCGTRPVNVKELGVDFYVAGTLKYLLGPPGLAFLYVREELVERLFPTQSGWFAQRNPFAFDVRNLDPAPAARRFESGTPPIPSIYGSLAALKLLESLGLEQVRDQIAALAKRLLKGAAGLGIDCKTPEDSVGPLVVLRSRDVEALLGKLAQQGIIGSSRHDGLRISFHAYNTPQDVDAVLEVLRQNLPLMAREETAAPGRKK